MKHQRKTGQPRFVQLFHWMLNSPAWKDLDANARAIYVELTRRYNGSNNGRIAYSVRQAAADLKISKDTAARAFRSLKDHGFIVCERRGAFQWKVRHASEYRLTTYDSNRARSLWSYCQSQLERGHGPMSGTHIIYQVGTAHRVTGIN